MKVVALGLECGAVRFEVVTVLGSIKIGALQKRGSAMSVVHKTVGVVGIAMMASCSVCSHEQAQTTEAVAALFEKGITSDRDIYPFFPQSVAAVHCYAAFATQCAQKALNDLCGVVAAQQAFANTAQVFDTAVERFSCVEAVLKTLELVSPEKEIRDACHQELIALQQFAFGAFFNPKVYGVFKGYVDGNATKEALNEEQRYFLQEIMRDFRRKGLELPEDKFNEVRAIGKQLAEAGTIYDANLNADTSSIQAMAQELDGLTPQFIQGLSHDGQGNYTLKCDYPTVNEVMSYCHNAQTRKRMYLAYNNRAYPCNIEPLGKIIALSDTLAKKLGFPSYAAMDIEHEMAGSPDKVRHFLEDLLGRARAKMDKEFAALKADLPSTVNLDAQGRFEPWDFQYVTTCYKKKYFDIDNRLVAEYFPIDHVLKGVFALYERFFDLEFELITPGWSWHKDVLLVAIRDRQSKALKGYVFLDLYPRPGRYSWGRVVSLMRTTKHLDQNGSVVTTPAVMLIITNFSPATGGHPALLKPNEVSTLIHEFGHAMHSVLGATAMASLSGIKIKLDSAICIKSKLDFIELPSQLFQEWMDDKAFLKGLSAHYKTHKPLPDALIDRLISLKQFMTGFQVTGQCMWGLVGLDIFSAGSTKNIPMITQKLREQYDLYIRYAPESHWYAAGSHLTNYAACYYSYLWSQVYALDIFDAIKREGLFNPQAGKRLADTIFSFGASKDPNVLVKNYLGREPRIDAFCKNLGF
jgi:thimet oligopeptidase